MNHEKAMPDRKRVSDVGTRKKSSRFSWVVKAGTKKAQNSIKKNRRGDDGAGS